MCIAAAIVGAGAATAAAGVYSSNKASSSASKATDAASASAADAAQLGQDQLAFDRQQYDDQKSFRDQASQLAIDSAQQQADQAKVQAGIAADTNAYQTNTFRPLEQKIVSDAQSYDTPERRAAAEAEAAAGVEQSYGSAQDGLARSLARTGVTYGSGRSQALMQDAALSKAGALAGATTGASRNVEALGTARMQDAASLGRNLASNQVAQISSSTNATNSSVGAGATAINDAAAGIPAVNAGYSNAMSGALGAGNLYGNVADIYTKQATAADQALGGLGSGALQAYSIYTKSDENVKSNTGKKLDPAKALKGIEKTPVHAGWMYDPSKGGPDDGGKPHDGPMAQDMAENMGPDVSDGHQYDPISLHGHVLAGMQQLAKRMKKLEQRKAA